MVLREHHPFSPRVSSPNRPKSTLEIKGKDITHHPGLQRSINLFTPRVCRHGNDRNMAHDLARGLQPADPTCTGQAIHDGHFQIHEDDAQFDTVVFVASPEGGFLETFEAFAPVVSDVHDAAEIAKLFLQNALIDEVVFYNQDSESVARDGFWNSGDSGKSFGGWREDVLACGRFAHTVSDRKLVNGFCGSCGSSGLDVECKDTAFSGFRGYTDFTTL